MIIPQIQGNFNQQDFFIYAACDNLYFDEFGKTLINSIQRNSAVPIHLHLFNPRDDQLQFCREKRISTTYETVSIDNFTKAADRWGFPPKDKLERLKYEKTLTSMKKGNDKSKAERMMKTYFACVRFLRLAEIINSKKSVFLMDIDAIFRKELPKLNDIDHPSVFREKIEIDFYIYKNKKSNQFLAGGIYITGSEHSFNFLQEYATLLRNEIENDYLYWSLDQDILDKIVPKYQYRELPFSMIDWNMESNSCIWTAKGKRKELEIFINEQKKYRS
jgi:hypothetical protein